MDFFQHRYYKLNKTFMTLGGSWPCQSTRTRWGITIFLTFILTSQIVPQILALLKYRNERAIVVECIITFLFEAICIMKWLGYLWHSQDVMKLLNRIRTDWKVWARDREVNILHEYAERGRKMTLVYTAEIYTVTFVYVTQPTIPKIIDVLLENGTASGVFPTPVDCYHIDAQKYYFYIVMYTYVCLSIGLIPFVISENMLIVYMQHICGVYAALRCKLQRIGNNNTSVQSGGTSQAMDKKDIASLASCIERHNDAVRYTHLIEATYTWIIFCIVGLGMIMLNLIGLQILWGKSNPETTVRFIGIAMTTMLHLYVECYISQMLMDHSLSIHLYIYDSQWYKLSPKVQKLLQFMLMRCSVPCTITAGNFFILSLRTFGQVIRTAMSYFAVVRSM